MQSGRGSVEGEIVSLQERKIGRKLENSSPRNGRMKIGGKDEMSSLQLSSTVVTCYSTILVFSTHLMFLLVRSSLMASLLQRGPCTMT